MWQALPEGVQFAVKATALIATVSGAVWGLLENFSVRDDITRVENYAVENRNQIRALGDSVESFGEEIRYSVCLLELQVSSMTQGQVSVSDLRSRCR